MARTGNRSTKGRRETRTAAVPEALPAPSGSSAELVEELGELFARGGSQRISGRIVGWLLVCVPEHQTAAQIQEGVRASKGSVSTVLRQLVDFGLIERLGLPGDRRTYYRLRPDGWVTLFETKMRFIHAYRDAAQRWARRLADDPKRRERIDEMAGLYRFLADELDRALARWRRGRRTAAD